MSFQPFTPNPNADDPFNSYPAMSTGVADEFGLPFFSPDDFSKATKPQPPKYCLPFLKEKRPRSSEEAAASRVEASELSVMIGLLQDFLSNAAQTRQTENARWQGENTKWQQLFQMMHYLKQRVDALSSDVSRLSATVSKQQELASRPLKMAVRGVHELLVQIEKDVADRGS
ncbi:hypothetical protein DM02DRAFT_628884 [Periconia macrospinosa]|uniref:Uncharacterized protein n=1 Tax=Periconia macrospinosa TaxID=97972 RepID=A0A2V1DPQ0_9PLEO|nr:hypothetical protein DM02DRAFT_628884 [Periconia macrospinosa]